MSQKYCYGHFSACYQEVYDLVCPNPCDVSFDHLAMVISPRSLLYEVAIPPFVTDLRGVFLKLCKYLLAYFY